MSSWARSRDRSISRLPDRKHESHDQHEQREQHDRVDRDLPPLARARRGHQWVTSLRVTNSAVEREGPGPEERHARLAGCGQAHPDRLAPGRRRRRHRDPDRPGIEPAVGQLGGDPAPDRWSVGPDDRRLASAGRSSGVEDDPGVGEVPEDHDRREHRDEDQRHDEDRLDGRDARLRPAAADAPSWPRLTALMSRPASGRGPRSWTRGRCSRRGSPPRGRRG